MNTRSRKLQLGDSWVVEGSDEDDENYSSNYDEISPPSQINISPRYPTRFVHNQSPEPELVMPSLDHQSVDGFWADRLLNQQRSTRSSEGAQEVRRRMPQSNGSSGSEKRLKQTTVPAQRPQNTEPRQTLTHNTQSELWDILEQAVSHTTKMAFLLLDVLWGALGFLKKPLSFLIAIWLLFGVLVLMRNFVTNSLYSSLSPICRLPGTSFLNLPFCPDQLADPKHGAGPSVEFEQLMDVQSKFEEVLEESAGRIGLPVDMKSSEASIRDLRQLVRYSQLHSK